MKTPIVFKGYGTGPDFGLLAEDIYLWDRHPSGGTTIHSHSKGRYIERMTSKTFEEVTEALQTISEAHE